MIKKILIANRGEIAIRIMRTAKEMGIRTVAVYSDADATALHPQFADEAVSIGGSAPTESYLVIENILNAARVTGADAIHPGYGFLSERAEFAEACRNAGIAFLGPSPEAMRALGGKIEAKQIAVGAGVPVTPGFFEPGANDAQLKSAAATIGYPVMLKASAGGGGRGMRIVQDEATFDETLELARDEAISGFGDGAMMVEKLVMRPRHVEVQIIADQHGNVAPLFERECSIQRRHQKLIEEAPSPFIELNSSVWEGMRNAAVQLAHAAKYVGAGTVEFIVDPTTSEFYFLEVNARLQVEHPVTEGVTGLDLVRLQIEVANGKNLAYLVPEFLTGDRKNLRGHCLEARIVAENPAMGFMPSIGRIAAWAEPKIPGVRIDTGFGPSSEVTRFYDSLIAKVIVTGPNRNEAIARMIVALEDFHIIGVKTNIGYLLDVFRHPEFQAGEFDTGFLGREFEDWDGSCPIPVELADLLPFAVAGASATTVDASTPKNPAWSSSEGWRNARK